MTEEKTEAEEFQPLPKPPEGRMTLRVNGHDYFVDPKQRSLLDALLALGIEVPHFCWHPGLPPDGNCRMCVVNLADPRTGKPICGPNLASWKMEPKLFISCRTPLDSRGMMVETENERIRAARRAVLEFLQLNHPLDCPVCDKAGECMLQDNCFKYGSDHSRFIEEKNEKPPKELGPNMALWTDRCILCARCVRFLDKVAGTSELRIINRGDRNEIAVAADHPLDNPLEGNIADICPVGALINKRLIYSYRAWMLRPTPSVCPGCAKGCNIHVDAAKEYVRRLRPRACPEVNGFWMCDFGRFEFSYINARDRLLKATVDGQDAPVAEAARRAGERLAEYARKDPKTVAGLASTWLTVEELEAFKQLFAKTLGGAATGAFGRPDGREYVFPHFKIEADKNPNRAGAQLVLGEDCFQRAAKIIADARAKRVKALYLISAVPNFIPPADLLDALPSLELLVVQDLAAGEPSKHAHIVLPAASFAEKDGTFVNIAERKQKIRRAIDPLGEGYADLDVLRLVARGAGAAATVEAR